ncbi:hypothetical protein OC842_003708 [Tilletia horrida]|uniref:Hyphally-regulated cell wall protein N-terminal domain-containing protein n=1 Tax=Tilletia horrida TaxID=155126 RepID=A0AAN6GFP8_9BASI|nr:hypothetical protein OC842_003708 [Tilletia horrida]
MLCKTLSALVPLLAVVSAVPDRRDETVTAPVPDPAAASAPETGLGPETASGEPITLDQNQYFLWVDNLAADNSTASLHAEGNGTIAALGQFNAGAGVRWTQDLLEVGYSAKVGDGNTLGGGYTINGDGISVGAGIGVNGAGTSFSLTVHNNGSIVASVFGGNLNCSVEGSKATCTN